MFRDIDSDGAWDAGEPGQAGIAVTATCIADTGTDTSAFDDVYGPSTSTTTAANGSFSLSGAGVRGLCRVEFAIPAALQTFLQPGVATTAVAAPNSAGSHVQFVDATLNPTVTTAVHNPGDYTGATSTPDIATGRAIPGAASAAANNIGATYDTVYRTDYGLGAPTALAQGEDSGSIWGIAWEPATETIFAAAVVKRHSGLLAGGPDAIYAYGPSVPTGWTTPFTAVDTDAGAVGTDAARGLGNGSAPERRRRRVRAGRHARLGRPRHLRGRPHALRRQPPDEDGPADRHRRQEPPAPRSPSRRRHAPTARLDRGVSRSTTG